LQLAILFRLYVDNVFLLFTVKLGTGIEKLTEDGLFVYTPVEGAKPVNLETDVQVYELKDVSAKQCSLYWSVMLLLPVSTRNLLYLDKTFFTGN